MFWKSLASLATNQIHRVNKQDEPADSSAKRNFCRCLQMMAAFRMQWYWGCSMALRHAWL